MTVWALTGPGPNALSRMAHETVQVRADATATIQEVHGTLIHALCAELDRVVLDDAGTAHASTDDPAGQLSGWEAP